MAPGFARAAAVLLRSGRVHHFHRPVRDSLNPPRPGHACSPLVSLGRRLATAAAGDAPLGDAGAELQRIHLALADAFGAEKTALTNGKLELDLGPAIGFYSLSSETSGRPPVEKILLTSPVSGARWYVFDGAEKSWRSQADGHHLVELFVREIMHSTSRYVNL